MILDSGVCSIFRSADVSDAGDMPTQSYSLLFQGWFGEVSFETSPARPTDYRSELKTDAKIRILQTRSIKQDDVVVLAEVSSPVQSTYPVYRITRAYHGMDDGGPMLITDLTLEVYEP